MNTRQATFTASPASLRAGLLGLAAVASLTLLSGVSHIADRQVDQVRLAQARDAAAVTLAAAPDAPVHVFHIVAQRLPKA